MLEKYSIKFSVFLVLILFSLPFISKAMDAVGTDSRIRTFVYGPNDVFRVVTTYGYQTTIEFEEDEKIRTISLGNAGYFRVTPLKNKIFLRALQSNLLTNVTVITSKRTYQFEFSSIINSLDDIMYVVKFYYPNENGAVISAPNQPSTPSSNVVVPEVRLGGQQSSPQPMQQMQIMQQPPMSQPPSQLPMTNAPVVPGMNNGFAMQTPSAFNYNYSLTGAESISPSEVFDDNIRTYFKFNNQNVPSFKLLNPQGGEVPANYQFSNGYYVVEGIAPQINVYFGSDKISVYNENYGMR